MCLFWWCCTLSATVWLASLGSLQHKFPAKALPQQGRYCSGVFKASVQDGVTSNLEQIRQDVKILIVSGERRGDFLASFS